MQGSEQANFRLIALDSCRFVLARTPRRQDMNTFGRADAHGAWASLGPAASRKKRCWAYARERALTNATSWQQDILSQPMLRACSRWQQMM